MGVINSWKLHSWAISFPPRDLPLSDWRGEALYIGTAPSSKCGKAPEQPKAAHLHRPCLVPEKESLLQEVWGAIHFPSFPPSLRNLGGSFISCTHRELIELIVLHSHTHTLGFCGSLSFLLRCELWMHQDNRLWGPPVSGLHSSAE